MNLIICCTPLQMLLASRIRRKYPKESFFLVLLCLNYNVKYEHYFKKVSKNFEKSKVVVLFHNRYSCLYIFSLMYIKMLSLILPKFNKIFIANIDLLEIQLFLSNRSKVFTFDDGTANFSLKSSLFSEDVSIKRKIVNFLFFNNFTTKKIRSLSSKHYTLYKGVNNIVEESRLEYIDLFAEGTSCDSNHNNKEVSIFIGQTLDIHNSIMEKIFNVFNITHYYPHPRDISRAYNIKYIETNLILEDYILSGVKEHVSYKIYTFFSGAVLNLVNIPNVKIIPIYLDGMFGEYDDIYNVFNKFNLDIVKLEI